jgi:hypothetical protein
MTTTAACPPVIRFADGSRVVYLGRDFAAAGMGWTAIRPNGEALTVWRRGERKQAYYQKADLAVAALAALGEGPAGEMRMRE